VFSSVSSECPARRPVGRHFGPSVRTPKPSTSTGFNPTVQAHGINRIGYPNKEDHAGRGSSATERGHLSYRPPPKIRFRRRGSEPLGGCRPRRRGRGPTTPRPAIRWLPHKGIFLFPDILGRMRAGVTLSYYEWVGRTPKPNSGTIERGPTETSRNRENMGANAYHARGFSRKSTKQMRIRCFTPSALREALRPGHSVEPRLFP